MCVYYCLFFFFKQKTAYEMRISDWSSDVCSSDLFIYLYRLGNKEKLGLGFSDSKVQQLPEAIKPLFSQIIPFSFQINEDLTVEETRSEERRVGKECVSTV